MNRCEIKLRGIVSEILTAAPILYFSTQGTAVQILKTIRFFFYFATIHLKEVRHQNPRLVTGVFFYILYPTDMTSVSRFIGRLAFQNTAIPLLKIFLNLFVLFQGVAMDLLVRYQMRSCLTKYLQ